MFHRLFALLLLASYCLLPLSAQAPPKMHYPLETAPGISGNFGELRPNHFHSGVDFRTETTIGKRVLASDNGWVSRISVSPGGYGVAIYLNHPSGLTTVYGHLDRLTPRLDSLVEEYQYRLENFVVNLMFREGELPVEKGELIAYSGNSGSSQAPHLHYEVRKTATNEALDPLNHLPLSFVDTQQPLIGGVLLAPVDRNATVNGTNRFALFGVNSTAQCLSNRARPTAWGRIQAGVRAIDKMDETYHKFGISTVRLWVDDTLVSELHIDRVDLNLSRHYNALIYYPEWYTRRGLFLSSYKQPGGNMNLYTQLSAHNGAVIIDQERPYLFRYEVIDRAGNISVVHFTVTGKPIEIASADTARIQRLAHSEAHCIETGELTVKLPQGVLFDDFDLTIQKIAPTDSSAPYYAVGSPETALGGAVTLALRPTPDTLTEKRRYYVAKLSDGQSAYLSGRYENGWVVGQTHEWGNFAVAIDSTAPTITPVALHANGIRIMLAENGSGIKRYRATLDGEFLLLKSDTKRQILFGKVPRKRFGPARSRSFELEAEDNCGNMVRFEKKVVI